MEGVEAGMEGVRPRLEARERDAHPYPLDAIHPDLAPPKSAFLLGLATACPPSPLRDITGVNGYFEMMTSQPPPVRRLMVARSRRPSSVRRK